MEQEDAQEELRVWCDGCYDIAHLGHANSLRQAKALGSHLIVGVHSDEEILLHKSCPPVFNEEERAEMIRCMRWVDEVVEGAPYITTVETLRQYRCAYVAHGNDITTTSSGLDTYHLVKAAGMYKEVERSHGISTTDLVRRILNSERGGGDEPTSTPPQSPYTGGCQYLWTSQKIRDFASGCKPIPRDARVVYVPGSFDLFHPGHLSLIRSAREHGDYLIAGVYDDKAAAAVGGGRPPIMNLAERSMSLLACRWVDEVVMAAPLLVTQDLLEHLSVVAVVTDEAAKDSNGNRLRLLHPSISDETNVFIKLSNGSERQVSFHVVHNRSTLTTQQIIHRVLSNRNLYTKRNADKEKKEKELIRQQQQTPQTTPNDKEDKDGVFHSDSSESQEMESEP